MNLSSTFALGPLNIPLLLPVAAGTWLLAWLPGRILLRKEEENMRLFSDLLGSPLLPFLLTWKLSLLITDFRDVLQDPLLILYATGSGLNILIGILAGTGWTALRWFRRRPSRMVNRSLLIALAVFAVSAGGFSLADSSAGGRDRSPMLSDEFILYDEAGNMWTVSSDQGKTIILNFWASWCPPCRAEMPMLDRMASDDRYSEVAFYAVNATATEKSPTAGPDWMEKNGFTLPVLLDSRSGGSSFFGISSLPTTIVIDPEGRVVEIKSGAVNRSWLASAIRKAGRGS